MLIAIVPILVLLIGILLLAFATNGNAREVGKACVWAGLFGLVLSLATHTVRIG